MMHLDSSVKPTDVLTTISTFVLAAAAIITIIVTRLNAKSDRAAQDKRVDAVVKADNARMEAERASADARLQDEYARAERQRLRDRQLVEAPKLLARVERFRKSVPHMLRTQIPGAPLTYHPNDEMEHAIRGLREGVGTEAVMLGDPPVRARYDTLTKLAEGANHPKPEAMSEPRRDRILEDLRRYAIFVRLSLQGLIDDNPVCDLDPPAAPDLERRPLAAWVPAPAPEGWQAAIGS
jgi:hypothetical protein